MFSTISVIIPAWNCAPMLTRCLAALAQGTLSPFEIIVVDDASIDDTKDVALAHGVTVLSTSQNSGPAYARNLGASSATGSILLFLDSDVCVARDTVSRITTSFEDDPALDALIGSYNNTPESPDFLSQYRNLMHAYVHHHGARVASTFWSGCGAIRRTVFLEHSGFSESYARPAIEDIELGYRLKLAGCRLILDPSIQVAHLKRWTFWGLLKTDILDRGIPWTELILRERNMPYDLNLQLSQRVSVALVVLLVCMALAIAIHDGFLLLVPPLTFVFLMLAAWWGEVFASKRPLFAYPLLFGMLAIIIKVAYTCHLYALILPIAILPAILLIRHKYGGIGGWANAIGRPSGLLYLLLTFAAAIRYIHGFHYFIYACTFLLVVTALLNSRFYVFLAGKRGLVFMLAAIPFHFLYHFYNGISFAAGMMLHLLRKIGAADARNNNLDLSPADRPPMPSERKWPEMQ